METVNSGSGAPDGNAGGNAGTPNGSADGSGSPDQETNSQDKSIRFEDHKRALDDMHKYKRDAQAASEKLRQLEEGKLREQNQFKELADKYGKERDEAKKELGSLKDSITLDRKHSAVHSAAIKLGLRPEAEADLDTLDLGGVNLEFTSTGKIRVLNADSFAQELKKVKPHWFKAGDVARVNTGGGAPPADGGNQELTAEYMGLLSRTNMAKYKELLPKYNEQKAAKSAR